MQSGLHIVYSKVCPTWLGGPPVPLQLVMSNLQGEADSFKQISQWVEQGKLRPVIDSEYAFEDALKASERIQSHRAKGKVIVNVVA
jgi:NADPH:quinone reductase-like Zn-dependent oxidoreductase